MAIVFHKQVLGLALVRGQLHARVMQGKQTLATWDAPGPLAGLDGLREALDLVPEQTGFRGESVVVAIASSQLEHQLVKLPPMRERDMEAFLSRKVRHLAVDAGRQAWSWHTLHGGKTERQVALHLLPLPLMHVFLDFCRLRNYQIDQVAPLASALAWSTRDLALPEGQWAMVAAEMGSATTLVVANSAGRLALVRELSFGLAEPDSGERLARELNRSILFAKQQFGIAISGIWISGSSGEGSSALPTNSVADVPVFPLPSPDPAAFWLHPLVGLDPDIHDNMVPRPLRHLNQRRRHLEATLAIVVGIHLFLASMIATLGVVGTSARDGLDKAHVADRITSLREEKNELEARGARIRAFEDQAAGLASATFDPKPGWFLAWLGQNLPNELRLSEALAERSADSSHWNVRLQGSAPREASRSAAALDRFQKSLEAGGTGFSSTRPWQEQWMANLRTGATWDNDTLGKPFVIEGRLR